MSITWSEMRYRILICTALLISILLAGCVADTRTQPEEPMEILFIGNSFIFFNDMPEMFAILAEAGGHQVNVASSTMGGYSLARHAQDGLTLSMLESESWDFVILQEKSGISAAPQERDVIMYPYVRHLNDLVLAQGGETILLMTWGNRHGLPQGKLNDYDAMQAEIAIGYKTISDELDVRLAPVGIAWQTALERDQQLSLWMEDGSHPSPLGSYLAANVLYALIFKQSPVGLPHPGGVEIKAETAKFLQEIAAEIVLENPKKWNIP